MMTWLKKAEKGQGVVEYAGALVVAAIIVGGVISLGPTGIQNIFNSILTSVSGFFTSNLPT
jgi:Flp pilus assembly pilin Flp